MEVQGKLINSLSAKSVEVTTLPTSIAVITFFLAYLGYIGYIPCSIAAS